VRRRACVDEGALLFVNDICFPYRDYHINENGGGMVTK
jgi:hypothetical protein